MRHARDRYIRQQVVIGALALLIGVVSLGRAPEAAAHAGNDDPLVMHACTKPQGQVRIVGVTDTCLPSEQAVHWGGEDQIVALQRAVATLQASVAALQNALLGAQATLACLRMEGTTDLIVEGCNVHVRSGGGATDAPVNGLGNLIVGYDEDDARVGQNPAVRTGSHNLVIGRFHTYSSFGGFVAGERNEVTAPSASVSGGVGNMASGNLASVSGGGNNTASSLAASVSGGQNNTASGPSASVSGGTNNTASGGFASVSGGGGNTAIGNLASVSAGGGNTASGTEASVSGGGNNTAIGTQASVSGGHSNTAAGTLASVSGGENNTAIGDFASVSGGSTRPALGTHDWVAGSLFEDH